MKDIVKDIFREIENIDWFSNCGKKMGNVTGFKLKQVLSLNDFSDNIYSLDWENVELEASNQLTWYLTNKKVKYEEDYNKIVIEIKSNLDFIIELNHQFIETYSLNIKDSLEWDILSYLVEKYYLNFNKHIPLFYHSLMEIYKNGNIPCGFDFNKESDFSKGGTLLYF